MINVTAIAVTMGVCALAGCRNPPVSDAPRIANVFDYGAKGDGIHDDTPAIQAAIDAVAARGGGKVFFPYTRNGYRLASPAKEFVNGRPCRSQLYIPQGIVNIQLEGEVPCLLLHCYMVVPPDVDPSNPNHNPTRFGTQRKVNVRLVSDWKPPVETNAAERPWSMLSVIPDWKSPAYPLNSCCVSIANLEFRAYLDKERMYAVQTAANLTEASRVIVRDSQFALNDHIGDTALGKELLESPCPTAGLVMGRCLCDDQVIDNVAVQGFKYGIIMAEHTHANYVYLHNNEQALVFVRACYHLSDIQFVVAEHNRIILSVPQESVFGHPYDPEQPIRVKVRGVSIEDGIGNLPRANQLKYGVSDPDNRLYGSIEYYIAQFTLFKPTFPVLGAHHFRIHEFDE